MEGAPRAANDQQHAESLSPLKGKGHLPGSSVPASEPEKGLCTNELALQIAFPESPLGTGGGNVVEVEKLPSREKTVLVLCLM